MTSLVLLAGSGTAGTVHAPFAVIAALFGVCRLWRYWAASRTYVARETEARRRVGAAPE
jgi:hypothetical protein